MTLSKNKQRTAMVFDLGGVLIDWDPKHLFRKIFKDNKKEMDHFLTVVCPQEWNVQQDAGNSFSAAIEECIREFPEYSDLIRAYMDRWDEMVPGEIPGTVTVLAALRQAGYPLYALSNWSAETFQRIIGRFEFLKWFDEIIISGNVKVVKPDPAIYTMLLDRIQYKPQDCLFIDDSSTNVEAARQLGFQTIRFTSAEHLWSALREKNFLPPV